MPGDSGGKTEYVQQSTSSEPWGQQQPYLTKGFERAEELLLDSGKPNYYPGSTVVGFSPETEQALSQTRQMALDGSSLTNGALDQVERTVNGEFLNAGNPHMRQAYEAASRPVIEQFNDQIAPGIDSNFAQAGRLGSNAYAQSRNKAEDTLARNLTDLSGKMAYQNYSQERQNQLQASQIAPQLAQARYNDANQLARVGAAREAQSQAELTDSVNRFNHEQNKDINNLSQYMAIVGGGSYGSEATSSQPVYSNPTSTFLGQASTGVGLLSSLGNLF